MNERSVSVLTRRGFLAGASAALLTSRNTSAGGISGDKLQVTGLQLEWLSPDLKKDFDGTLSKIASLGYREVELVDNFGRTPEQLLTSLNAVGLRCKSRLFWIDPGSSALQSDFANQLEFAQAMGLTYLVALMPAPIPLADDLKGRALAAALDRITLDDYKRQAELLNKLGAQAQRAKIQLGYHNFNTEFRRFDGIPAYDRLLQWTDPVLVKMEMDIGWLVAGGADPVKYFRENKGRFPLVHVKDVKERDPNTVLRLKPVEVGSGIVDWSPALSAARAAGAQIGYVEYEPEPPLERPLLESAKICIDYLRAASRR